MLALTRGNDGLSIIGDSAALDHEYKDKKGRRTLTLAADYFGQSR